MTPYSEAVDPFSVGNREQVTRRQLDAVGGGIVRLVAISVPAQVDVDDAVIPSKVVRVARFGPPRTVAHPPVKQYEWPSLASHFIADLDAVIRNLWHARPLVASRYAEDRPATSPTDEAHSSIERGLTIREQRCLALARRCQASAHSIDTLRTFFTRPEPSSGSLASWGPVKEASGEGAHGHFSPCLRQNRLTLQA